MASRSAEFVDIFGQVVGRDDAWPKMGIFLKGLSFDEVETCQRVYLAIFRGYPTQAKNSLRTFAEMALAALERGSLYSALRFEALTHAKDSPWAERFRGLAKAQQAHLLRQIKVWRRTLSTSQARFLELFAAAMKPGGNNRAIERHVAKLNFAEAHACLLVYLEASLRHADDQRVSLSVFFGVSAYVISKGDEGFAADFEKNCRTTGSVWQIRYNALSDDQKRQLSERLSAIRRRAYDMSVGLSSQRKPAPAGTPATKPVSPDVMERAPAKITPLMKTFTAKFERYLARADVKTKKNASDDLSEYIFQRSVTELRECLEAYLMVSRRHPPHSTETLTTFWGLASQLVAKGEGYDALKLRLRADSPGTVVATRYRGLNEATRQKLDREIAARTRPERLLILDALKLDYFKTHHRDPSLADLQGFNPAASGERLSPIRSEALACERTFGATGLKRFADAFDAYAKRLHAQTDEQVLLAMLKTVCEMDGLTRMLRAELYWYGVLVLFDRGRVRNPEAYDSKGFNREETDYLLNVPKISGAYRYDFDQRMDYAIRKRASRDALKDISRAHAVLLHIAERMHVRLSSMDETARVRRLVETLRNHAPGAIEALRIPVSSRFGNPQLRIGQTIGNAHIVWWDPHRSLAYVEVNGIAEEVLFAVNSYTSLGRMHDDDATYGEIWRGSQHLLVAIPMFFQIMGYLPDLVTGGLAGLVESIVVDLLANTIADQAGLDPTTAMLLSGVINTGSSGLTQRFVTGSAGLDDAMLDATHVATRGLDPPVAPNQMFNGPDTRIGGTDALVMDHKATARTLDDTASPRSLNTDSSVPTRRPDTDVPPERPRRISGADHGDTMPDTPPRKDVDAFEQSKAPPKRSDDKPQPKVVLAANKQQKRRIGSNRNKPGDKGSEEALGRTEDSRALGKRGDAKGPPPPYPPTPPRTRITNPWFGETIVHASDPLLADLIQLGYRVRFVPAKQPKSGGGAFQKFISKSDLELEVTAPNGIKALIDLPATDPHKISGLVFGETKATFVGDVTRSGHMKFDRDKTEQIARQVAVALESEGKIRIEIICNAPALLRGGLHFGGAETYLNIVHQTVARDLLARFPNQVKAYLQRMQRRPVPKPTIDEAEEIVNDLVSVTVYTETVRKREVGFGSVGGAKK